MVRAILMLLAGGAAAQALPLLIGPWLTRLFSPEDFGVYHLFASVSANVAVVACARYEFALPLSRQDDEAEAVRVLCLRVLAVVVCLSSLIAVAWAAWSGLCWPLWLPAAVAALGLLSLSTMHATRAGRFARLAVSRVLQHGGGALAQAVAGLWQWGVHGLIVAPIVSALAAVAALGWPGPLPGGAADRSGWRAAARKHRNFPLLNTPHAFLGALQDTLAVALVLGSLGPAAAGAWGLALRYLKAPATLVGGAVSQVLYPQLVELGCTAAGRSLVLRTMGLLLLLAAHLTLALWWLGPWLFHWAFGDGWAPAGDLARALALYIGLHFVASPLGVVTMAWHAQAWALKLAMVGQSVFVTALAMGLWWGGLSGAGWAVSMAMGLYFGYYFLRLATWRVRLEPEAAMPDPAVRGLL